MIPFHFKPYKLELIIWQTKRLSNRCIICLCLNTYNSRQTLTMCGYRKCSMSCHWEMGRQGKVINLSVSHWSYKFHTETAIYHLKFVSCLYSEITAHAPASVLFSPWLWYCSQPFTLPLYFSAHDHDPVHSPWPCPCTFQPMTMTLFTAHDPDCVHFRPWPWPCSQPTNLPLYF